MHRTLWLWDHVAKVWVKAPAAVTTKRVTGAGLVIAGAHKLHWISCNPSAGLAAWGLADDAAAGGDILLDHYHTDRDSHTTNLMPPMSFSTGIYLELYTNMTSMTFGYV